MKSSGLIKKFSALIVVLIAVLGFSCNKEAWCAYGIPPTIYRAVGTVVDDQTQKPLENVELAVYYANHYDELSDENYSLASGKTDADGGFDIEGYDLGYSDYILYVDGKRVPGYHKKIITFNFKDLQYEGETTGMYDGGTYDFGTIGIAKVANPKED